MLYVRRRWAGLRNDGGLIVAKITGYVSVSIPCVSLNRPTNTHRHFERRHRRLALKAIIGTGRDPHAFDESAGDFSPRDAFFMSGDAEAGLRNDVGLILAKITGYVSVSIPGASPIIIVISSGARGGLHLRQSSAPGEIPRHFSISRQGISRPAMRSLSHDTLRRGFEMTDS